MSRQLSINRHILIQKWQDLLGPRRVSPIAHQITHNGEQTVHLDARARHLCVGRVAHERRGRAGRFDVGEDGVACGAQREREEGGADEDDLLFAGGFDGGAEGGVIPCAVGEFSVLACFW
jgi:hypothetical protein